MVLRLKFLVAASLVALAFAAQAEVSFAHKKIVLTNGKHKKIIKVEVATTQQEHMQGLMFRKSLGENQGMLFVFNDERARQFWMKNTLIDLDIAYINKERKIIDIQQMQAQSSVMQTNLPTYPSKLPAQYALEMNKGWFKKNNFPEGSKFDFASGPLSK